MSVMADTAWRLIALAMLLVLAPAVAGVATRVKSLATNRRGAPVLQLYFDLAKLLRRGAVFSDTTTWVFRVAAPVALAATIVAALMVPLGGHASLIRFEGDPVAFIGTLALARFLLVLAAWDTGSSFEGMGASRDAAFAPFIELGILLVFGTLVALTHELTMSGMLGEPLRVAWQSGHGATLAIAAASLFALLLAESARVPVDDPATHLELTMVHEVMVLDHSGPDLAFLLYANALKLSTLGAMVVAMLAPHAGVSPVAGLAAVAGGLIATGVAVGIVEGTVARLRLPKVPLFVAGAASLGLLGTALAIWSPS